MAAPKVVWPLSRVILFWLLSTLLVTGSCTLAYLYYEKRQHAWRRDSQYTLRQVVQEGADAGRLTDAYLGALLGLASETPPNIYALSLAHAKTWLLESPWLEQVELKRRAPDTLIIRPKLRSPLFRLQTVRGAAVDEEGVLFPLLPDMNPEPLPLIALVTPKGLRWGDRIDLTDALWYLSALPPGLHPSSMDLTRLHSEQLGRREWIVTLGEHTLRLPPVNYALQLRNYQRMAADLPAGEHVIDLRLHGSAYVASE